MKRLKKIIIKIFSLENNKNNISENIEKLIKEKNIFQTEVFFNNLTVSHVNSLREGEFNNSGLFFFLIHTPNVLFKKGLYELLPYIYEDFPDEILNSIDVLIQREDFYKINTIRDFIKDNYKADIYKNIMRSIIEKIQNYFCLINNFKNINSPERKELLNFIKTEISIDEKLYAEVILKTPLSLNKNIFKECIKKEKNILVIKDNDYIRNNIDFILSLAPLNEKKINDILEMISINIDVMKENNIKLSDENKILFMSEMMFYFFDLMGNFINKENNKEFEDFLVKIKNILNKEKNIIDILNEYNKKISHPFSNNDIKINLNFYYLIISNLLNKESFDKYVDIHNITEILYERRNELFKIFENEKYIEILNYNEIDVAYDKMIKIHHLIYKKYRNKEDYKILFLSHPLTIFSAMKNEVGIYLTNKIIKEMNVNYSFIEKNLIHTYRQNELYAYYIKSYAEKEVILNNKSFEDETIPKKRL